MAHILVRKYGSGVTRYTANVRIRKGKRVIYRESKTFTHRAAAEKWAKSREVALEDPTALIRAGHGAPSLAELIRWYIDSFEKISKWQRSKQTHLEFLERHSIGKSNALALTPAILIDHIRSRHARGAGAATVANDLTWIGVVLRAAKSVNGLPVDPKVVEEARTACHELRLIAKARKRARRPTAEELTKLDKFFASRDRRSVIPMRDIVQFAIFSARREAEICRIEWRDNDPAARTGLVRDAKHPREKQGNHKRFKYTAEAWSIVERQPRTSEYVFPYNPKSIGEAFTRACHILGIKDLRFHDLRHEATSRLFERGYQIHEVAQFTLHESWNELKRYTNLRPETLREIRPTPPGADGENIIAPGTAPEPNSLPLPVAGRSARPNQSR
ncbi:MAG: tyrosine-type recombinase/integrase [Steroidobacteraceae bacterium]